MQKLGLYDKGLCKQAIPYFFTNFPEEWSYADMWRTFLKFGRVYDIYSPNKKSRSGGRFGFVRFLNVNDKRELERQLDQIWIGDQKLWVNIPRYDDEKKEEKKGRNEQTMAPKFQSRSYVEVLQGHGARTKEGVSKEEFKVDQTRRHGRGEIRNSEESEQWGGKMVLLDCEDKEELKDLVEMATDWLGQWFQEVRPWIPNLVAQESDSEDHESWSLGIDTDAIEEGFEKTQEPGEVSSTDAGKEDDEVASGRGKNKKKSQSQDRQNEEKSDEAIVDSLLKIQNSKFKSRSRKYREAGCDVGAWGRGKADRAYLEEEEKEKPLLQITVLQRCRCCCGKPEKELPRKETNSRKGRKGNTGTHLETKLENVDRSICRRVWGTNDFDWVAKASNGRSGGLLCVWNSKVFRKKGVVEGENYLGVCRLWGEEDTLVYIINICSPCLLMGKRALWEELQRLIASKGGKWCLAGDFNAVRKVERAGSREITREMREFDDFIQNTGLIDLPLARRKYNWYNSNGQYMSRIDRFLMSEEWILNWSDVKQGGLSRSVSDHCPILLKNESIEWGPKPFKFFNAWLDQPGCKEIITEVWNTTKVTGWNGYILKEKLKRTKNKLKEWSRNAISEVDRKVKEAEKEIATIDEKGEKGQLSPQDVEQRKNCFLELWKNIKIKESMWQQKSRKMWLKEGDANTKYFHTCVKGRCRRNEILSIHIKGDQHTGVAEIKEKVAKYFEELFTEEKWERPKLDGIRFNKISEANNDILTTTFSEEEIKEAIWECESSKSPGPDGFNFRFVKAMWEDIKADIVGFVQEFHKPISLIGVMYKILAKLLANRLRKVIHKVIGEQQMAFIRGRQLAEGVVIANEVIDEAKRNKKKSFLFKVNFEKAYDKVCWGFINYMMLRMGFCETWRRWIQECLRSSSVSIIVNGSPTRQFTVTKGIRQGDSLSPFLFLIVAEGLNGMVTAAIEKKLYKGVTMGSGEVMVSHLQFADDIIFFGEATEENIWAIKCIVRSFELVSGLKINYTSQLMGVNLEEGWKEKMACRLYCKGEDLPFKYLGIPIGGNHRKIAMWQPLVESVKSKLAPWKGRHLSFRGRITLINSVLSSLPMFLMSVYLLPKGILYSIDKIRKSFLWGGEGEGKKINWVKWDKVCKSMV
ncbi:hypothetical protein SLEP1_g55033 [Rubroshorea leprosula]|uniref:Reverse transcriptase domain-containing protein n=1 Tax=Rubroshorea leprosula TaxID=152421 RepID=A0AAV5MIB0_9ROSI|nr:hypothetical protein SLEP1_g55033 [Rubroshorea leprosula]